MTLDSQLFKLLRFYGHIRVSIFGLLSPSDIIALCEATLFVLGSMEKSRYTNPLLELFCNLDWMEETDQFTRPDVALVGDDLLNISKYTTDVRNVCMATVRHCKGECLQKHAIQRPDCGLVRPNVHVRLCDSYSTELYEIENGINVYIISFVRCNYDDQLTSVGVISRLLPLVCKEMTDFGSVPTLTDAKFYNGIHPASHKMLYVPTYLHANHRSSIELARMTVVTKDRMGFEFLIRSREVVSVDPYSPLAPALLGKPLSDSCFHCSEID